MRLIAMAGLVGICIAGAAFAQNAGMAPRWEASPTARDFAQAYPRTARDEGLSGYSLLCCTVRPNRTLDCAVAVDWPSGQGFDRAAQRVAREFRLSETGYAQLAPDTQIRRGIVWEAGVRTPELQAALDQIHEATKSTCTPPGVEAAPGADDIVTTMQRIG